MYWKRARQMEARTGSVADLFEAVVPLMIPPIDEDRAVVDLSATAWAGKVRCCRHGGYARTSPVVITLCAVGTKTCAVGSDAIAISILALASTRCVSRFSAKYSGIRWRRFEVA